nr:MAG TPA: hypothetical protein [Caudoviricetes sp.]
MEIHHLLKKKIKLPHSHIILHLDLEIIRL